MAYDKYILDLLMKSTQISSFHALWHCSNDIWALLRCYIHIVCIIIYDVNQCVVIQYTYCSELTSVMLLLGTGTRALKGSGRDIRILDFSRIMVLVLAQPNNETMLLSGSPKVFS